MCVCVCVYPVDMYDIDPQCSYSHYTNENGTNHKAICPPSLKHDSRGSKNIQPQQFLGTWIMTWEGSAGAQRMGRVPQVWFVAFLVQPNFHSILKGYLGAAYSRWVLGSTCCGFLADWHAVTPNRPLIFQMERKKSGPLHQKIQPHFWGFHLWLAVSSPIKSARLCIPGGNPDSAGRATAIP